MENILLTGSTGNLATYVVDSLLQGGYHLHLPVRTAIEGHGKKTSTSYHTNIIDSEQSGALVRKIISDGKIIHAAVFLAGGFHPGNLDNTQLEDINQMIQVNFGTAYTLARKLIAHFRSAGGGKLIFIGAKSAMDFSTAQYNLAYSLSKQLLFNFSALINESEKSFGITSHILLPGTIRIERDGHGDNADFTTPYTIADTIQDIIEGKEKRTIIDFNINGG
ncbi:SDR family NAD(P)-dependent oxidoreductase [Parapedobacter koreensis]|uniref:Short-chain dehydrogenase n=1 Tax=Parapedobacter koreensis TaxID=332977 RepID=A0A1H7IUQ3_9SPHI|nr:SDR family NAD(P)-dependent oxidoreductase [Parapedobacter koreensis]SEK66136.1 Short-chain dehydrogenase [Parapedobacter koreensis]